MSALRTQDVVLLALLLSASATAQEHVPEAMDSSAHADGTQAMQMADHAMPAQPQSSIATEASPPSAQETADAIQMDHAHLQHTGAASPSADAADSTPAQRPVQADVSASPTSMHHAGMQHADVKHAAHQASTNPQPGHSQQPQA
ncbi:copper resistance protein B, partial [Xanthomonas hortorum pv. gardneri]